MMFLILICIGLIVSSTIAFLIYFLEKQAKQLNEDGFYDEY